MRYIVLGARFAEYKTDQGQDRTYGELWCMPEEATNERESYGFIPDNISIGRDAYDMVKRTVLNGGMLPGVYDLEVAMRKVRIEGQQAYRVSIADARFIESVNITFDAQPLAATAK